MRRSTVRLVLGSLVLSGLLLAVVAAQPAPSPPAGARPAASTRPSGDAASAPALDAAGLLQRAARLFDEQRYAEAVPLLQQLERTEPRHAPRQQGFYRAANTLRLAMVQNDEDIARKARLSLRQLAEDEMDAWGARAVRELVRSNDPDDGTLQRLLDGALTHWEALADVALATGEYLELFEALLPENGWVRPWLLQGGPPERTTLLRMWSNLVAAQAPQPRLLALAERILHEPGSWPYAARPELSVRVARDVLQMETSGPLRAAAHLRLGIDAQARGRYRQAASHLRDAVAAAPAQDSPHAQQAQRQLDMLVTASVQVEGAELYRTGSHHALRVSWRNVAGWTLQLRRLDPVADLRAPATVEGGQFPLRAWYPAGAGRPVSSLTVPDTLEVRARAEGGARGANTPELARSKESLELEPHVPRWQVVPIDPLPPGIYAAELSLEPAPGAPTALPADASSQRLPGRRRGPDHRDAEDLRRLVFQVTELGLVQQPLGDGRLEVWLVDMGDGRPQGNVDLLLHAARIRERSQLVELEWRTMRARTDRDGIARFGDLSSDDAFVTVVGVSKSRPVVLLGGHFPFQQRDQGGDWRSFVLTDRPLYRPRETVHLQGFVRRREPAERVNVVPQGEPLTVIFLAPDGTEALRRDVKLDDNGSFTFDHELPARPALGAWQVQLRRSTAGDGHEWLGGASFQVDEYRLPEFTVTAELDASRRWVLGDTLQVQVAAEYLFGGPVRGVAEVVVTRAPRWIFYRMPTRYGWLHDESAAMGNAHSRQRKIAAPWGGGGDEVLRVTLPLQPDGTLLLAVPTSTDDGQGVDYTYTIEARVTDESRREERGIGVVPITRQELYAFLSPERHVIAPHDDARVRLRVQDAQDRGVLLAGHVEVTRIELNKDGKRREIPVMSRDISTDAQGDALIPFRPEQPGYYEVRYSARDTRGEQLSAQTVVWCAGPDTRAVVHGAGALQLIAAEDEFDGTEVARVLLVSDTPGAVVYLSRYFSTEVETQVLHLKGTAQLLTIPLDDLHRPWFWLQAATARDFRLQQATARIVAPLSSRAVDVSLQFERPGYRPGEQASLRIVTKDALGRAVKGPVTVAVVDQAVLAILPRSLPDPNAVFNDFSARHPGDLWVSAQLFGGFAWLKDPARPDLWPPRSGDADGTVEESVARQSGVSFEEDAGGVAVGSAMPASAMERSMAKSDMLDFTNAPAPAAPPGMAPVTVRTDFRTTALWRTAVWTDEDGTARVEVPLAESLTGWEALGVAITPSTQAGTGTATTRTRKDVMVRLNHPRVFREKDRFLVAATVHNDTDRDLDARVSLAAAPLSVEGGEQQVRVPAHGQSRVEWWAGLAAGAAGAKVERDSAQAALRVAPGQAVVRVTALTDVESDAFERPVDLLPHGTPLRVVAAGEVRAGEAAPDATSGAPAGAPGAPGTKAPVATSEIRLTLPADRLRNVEVATLTLSPSVLSACLDALGFLAQYPYGCTEQTLSRFVPAASVRAVARALDVPVNRIDPELDAKIAEGLRRIADFQHADGGWGWWKEDDSQLYMTAHALLALSRAKEAGVELDAEMLRRGRAALRSQLAAPGVVHDDDLAHALAALAAADGALRGAGVDEDELLRGLAARLLKQRDRLSDYARGLLALYLARADRRPEALQVLQHLENTVQLDPAYGTVHWGKTRGYWWHGEGAVETTAFIMDAYAAVRPDHPHRRGAARWLLVNREGDRWQSTRATAHVLHALIDFARDTGELTARYTVVASVGSREIARATVTPKTLLDAGGQFALPVGALREGENAVQLRLEGNGVCYATVSVDTWTAVEGPAPTESWLGVTREIVRLRPLRTLGGTLLQFEETLREGDAVASGDRIRVRLRLTAHNDLSYIAIEDPRPAGCEPIDQLSGWFHSGEIVPLRADGRVRSSATTGKPVSGRREVRDALTAFFASRLEHGEHVLTYELRAESPGTYHVMPTRAFAMYVPDVNGSSAEARLNIGGE